MRDGGRPQAVQTRRVTALLASADRLEKVEKALQFYANPFNQVDEHGEHVTVPDFYSELDFGWHARAALNGETDK